MSLFPTDAPPAFSAKRRKRVLWMLFGMVYLLVWPLSAILHADSRWSLVVGLVALASYVLAFVVLIVANNPWSSVTTRLSWIMLAVLTVFAVSYPLLMGKEWVGLPIYLGVAYAMTLPPRLATRGVLAATALTFVLCLAAHSPVGTLALLTFETLTIGMLMLAFRSSRILVVQLAEARGEVARLAANEERLRIARDLHDLLGHTLSLIVLKSELASRLADRDPVKSLAEVDDIHAVARQALTDVREAISGYRQRNLTDELQNARNVLAAADIELTVTTSGTPLPDQVDGLFGWAVREGVTNIVRHSRARTASITVCRRGEDAVLEVVDDGTGAVAFSEGNGLRGLNERVAATGGTLDAGPRGSGGFRLHAQAPLTAPASREPAEESA